MKIKGLRSGIACACLVAMVALVGVGLGVAAPTSQTPIADPAFQKVWARTDTLVAEGKVKRSFYWGPAPDSGPIAEAYAEGANGKHLVQYFDKGRMEINDPTADPTNPFYVTPGRLTMELVSGQIQTGNNKFMPHYAANIPIAGDTDDPTTPTYASFAGIAPGVDPVGLDQTGKAIVGVASKDKGYGENGGFASSGVKNAFFEPVTKHNIPDVFWAFLNTRGPITIDGRQVDARLSDPYFYVTGFPITEAWWVYAKVNGKAGTPVLVQLYERRVLTYVADAPEGFKVQMGNIGQHYYDWRYKGGGQPDPVQGCKTSARSSFGPLWTQDRVAQSRLLCAVEYPKTVPLAMQHFEHGHMIYIDRGGVVENYSVPKRIFVLFDDGSLTYFPDTFSGEAQPPVTPTPPAGLIAPVLGFGKVWRDNPEVRQKLGWALVGERGISKENYQFFQAGFMVRDGGKLYGIYEFTRFWSAFDDKYVP